MTKKLRGNVVIPLTLDERNELNALNGTNQKIKYLLEKEWVYSSIQAYLGVGPNKISTVSKALKTTGICPPDTVVLPPKKTPQCIALILSIREANRAISDQAIANRVSLQLGYPVSRTLVNEVCRKGGYKYKPMKNKPLLTPEHKRRRMAFAATLLRNQVEGRKIIFSDESRFVLGTDNRWVWTRSNDNSDQVYKETAKFPSSVMIFGAIGYNYKSKLVIIEGSVNTDRYLSNLRKSGVFEHMESNPELLFQQDGAPCHTAAYSLEAIRCQGSMLANWPANSPDLNVIENLWGIMKHTIERAEPKTKLELVECINTVWDELSIDTINTLVDQFTPRLCKLLSENGECISQYCHSYVLQKNESVEYYLTNHASEIPDIDYVLPKWEGDKLAKVMREHAMQEGAINWTPQMDLALVQCTVKRWGLDRIASYLGTRNTDAVEERLRYLQRNKTINFVN